LSDEPTPISWLLIEPGWRVVGTDGSQVGTVQEVVGDSGKDIFDGLAVSTGILGKPRYVPAERVVSIIDGHVEVDVPVDAEEQLAPYEEPPPSEEILPVTASWWQRLLSWLRR
jgi:sporulation protein YlmC with PRC-barrel domain